MRPSLKIWMAASVLFLVTGAFVAFMAPGDPGPAVPRRPPSPVSVTAPTPVLDPQGWGAPWAQPPRALRPPVASPLPMVAPPVVVAPVVPPDQTSVQYLGSLVTSGDLRTYLFKFRPANRILRLVPGVPSEGWTLDNAGPDSFDLHGPGGPYASSR